MSGEFTKVSRSIWRSRKFREVNNNARFVYLYFLTNPLINSCGVLNIASLIACAELKITPDQYSEAISKLKIAKLIEQDIEDDEVFRIVNWFKFSHPGENPNHVKKLRAEADGLSAPMRRAVMAELSKYRKSNDKAPKCHPNGIAIPSEEDRDGIGMDSQPFDNRREEKRRD